MLSLFHSFATQMQPIMVSDPTTSTTTMTTTSSNTGIDGATFAVFAVVFLVLLVLFVVCNALIFSKLGEKGWKSIIPIYNTVTFLRLGNQSGWWVLVGLVPFLGAIVLGIISAFAAYTIGLKLHKPGWFVVLYILVSPIWLIILAFSKSASATPQVDSTGFVSGANMTPPPFSPTAPAAPSTMPQPPEQPSNTPTPPTPPAQF